MHVARFFCAGLARQDGGQWWFAMRQTVERCDDVVERVEVVHAIGTTPEFSRCLWPAQKKDANDGNFPPVEVKYFLQPVLVFCNPAVGSAGRTGQSFFLKR